jgi:hypothetical protein
MRSAPCASARVTHYTLCPLGEPEIAIGHEPRIEPWLPRKRPVRLPLSQLDGIVTISGETQQNGQPATSPEKRNYSGLDLEKKSSRPPVEAELFS